MINTKPVSFKSRINIVTEKTFRKLPRGVFINYYADKRNSNIVKAANFSTYGIRTCTGGGLMSRFDNAALGFHIWDETTNIPDILIQMDAEGIAKVTRGRGGSRITENGQRMWENR